MQESKKTPAFLLFFGFWNVLFAPAALAADGAKKVARGAHVRRIDILRRGRHDVIPAGWTNERAGVTIERTGNENAPKHRNKSYRDQQNSYP